jgi:hypothetical protein
MLGIMPLVSMSDKRLGGMANSSLSNLCAMRLLASSTSLKRYPRDSLSARSLCPPLCCTPADLWAYSIIGFDGATNITFLLNFLISEQKQPHGYSAVRSERIQADAIGRIKREAVRERLFGFRNRKFGLTMTRGRGK